jgi:hypothetical protein
MKESEHGKMAETILETEKSAGHPRLFFVDNLRAFLITLVARLP